MQIVRRVGEMTGEELAMPGYTMLRLPGTSLLYMVHDADFHARVTDQSIRIYPLVRGSHPVKEALMTAEDYGTAVPISREAYQSFFGRAPPEPSGRAAN